MRMVDELFELAAPKDLDPYVFESAVMVGLRHFKKAKDAAGCRRLIAMSEELKPTDARCLYNLACYHAVTAAVLRTDKKSAAAAREADAEADTAMTWLKQAVAAGFKNVTHMRNDEDLDNLRGRQDFQKLIAGLE